LGISYFWVVGGVDSYSGVGVSRSDPGSTPSGAPFEDSTKYPGVRALLLLVWVGGVKPGSMSALAWSHQERSKLLVGLFTH